MSSEYDRLMKAKKFLPLNLDYLPPELVEKARIELNETEETRTKCIQELREKVIKESCFECRTDDAYLLIWLRARKFNTERAFELLQNLLKLHMSYRELYRHFDEEKNTRMLANEHACLLPYRDQNGCAIIILRINNWNPDEFDIVTFLRLISHMTLHAYQNVATQVCGVQCIVDVKGATLKQMKCFTPYYLMLVSKGLKNTAPLRFKHIHFINESVVFQYLWSVLKVFLSQKINDRVHFYGNKISQLQNYIPKAILPYFYGGDNTDFSIKEFSLKEFPATYKVYQETIDICRY